MKKFNDYINKISESNKYDNISEEEQLKLIDRDPYNIQYITNPSEKVQMKAILTNPRVIKHISKPTEKIQLAAVKKYPNSIKYILEVTESSEKVRLTAININPSSIIFINDPSEKEQMEAIKKDINILKYFFREKKEMCELANIYAVKKYWKLIYYNNKPSKLVQLEAVKQDINAIFYIEDPDPEAVFYCITSSPDLLKIKEKQDKSYQKLPENYFKNLQLEVQKMLVEYNPLFRALIDNLHPDLKKSLTRVRNTGLI
jgi:hypothetical protein